VFGMFTACALAATPLGMLAAGPVLDGWGGHATVATALALTERTGPGKPVFATPAGTVPVEVTEEDGTLRATLTGVEPHVEGIADADLAEALAALDRPAADLDPAFPPRIAFAGVRHLVLAAATRASGSAAREPVSAEAEAPVPAPGRTGVRRRVE
ncbi:PhzF family phenazine biosynthesis protein, partial [Streptomyces sp. NPDC006324]|uniref:PhzF family phenazine biosynthesis protein n=1 Tax=Streptomyces sp. NPDC006324 TaxID=3156751 RepID=UPI0033B29C31